MMTRNLRISIAASLMPACVIFTVFFIIPIGIMIVTSFYDWGARGMTFIGLENYIRLMDDFAFHDALRNTAIWVAAAILLHVPLAVLVAVVLSKKMMGWKIFRTLFFIPNIISYAALSVVFLNFYNARFGLLNSILDSVGLGHWGRDWLFSTDTALAAIIFSWLFHVGLYMIIVMAEIVAIPDEIYEAADIDGASAVQKDLYITLPLLRNIIGTCMILAATQSLIYFEGVLLMTNGGPANATLNLPMFAYQEYSLFRWGYTNTIGLVILSAGLMLILIIKTIFRVGERDW